MSNARIIREALENLLQQQVSDGTFVIFENPRSKKFVQFCGSAAQLLQLDLPSQTLSEMEFYRAVAYFKRLGVAGEEYDLLDGPGGLPVARQFTFQMAFRSVVAAVEVALGIFGDVYQLPLDFPLVVTRGWQIE